MLRLGFDLFAPELPALNRMPARAPLTPHDSKEAALGDDPSPWRLSLDGMWNFLLVDSPDRIPAAWFANAGRASRNWNPVAVPGCWTRQRVGDWPHYTNVIMPWPDLDPPQTPARNPTGLYHRSFEIPAGWVGRDIVVHLGGFESMAVLWCNGRFVGMGKDSRLPSEFDITDHVQGGRNTIDIAVTRYSDATWIEDQDHWFHGGLHRSVFVEARSPQRIDDLQTLADFDAATGLGSLQVDAHVRGRGDLRVGVGVFADDRLIASAESDVAAFPRTLLAQPGGAYQFAGRTGSVTIDVGEIDPWSAESPRLYRVVVELQTAAGDVVEATALDVGFRRVEVRGRRLLVNGRAVILHGVNRHDHHPETGKVQTADDLRADLVSMKQHNINAVRCAHYPNDHVLLDLCDELGLYAIDEANVESHARLRSLTDDTSYLGAIVDRVKRMVLRDRNHASVIMWSLGNESGHGAAHDAAAAWVRAVDPDRPVHYEGALQKRFVVGDSSVARACQPPSSRERLVTDIVCPMYTPIATVVEWARWAEASEADDRPLILCEYSHAMGNSNGSIAEYADAFHAEPALAGGFIWDWKDQGLYEVDDRGKIWWAYGGHYGDEPNDANFCINGLVGPDGSPHPGLREVVWAYRPIATTQVRGRRVRILNRQTFASLADFRGEWTLLVDGDPIERGEIAVDVEPGRATLFSVPFETELGRDVEAHVRFVWKVHADAPWAQAGHEVAWDDIVLKSPEPEAIEHPAAGPARGKPLASVASADDTSLRWNSEGVVSLSFGSSEAAVGNIGPCLWRAPTDNDGVKSGWLSDFSGVRPSWIDWGLDRLSTVIDRVEQSRVPGGAQVVTMYRRLVGATDEAAAVTSFRLERDRVFVTETIEIPEAWHDLPRIGTRFETWPRADRLAWFGLGPHETYPDRKSSGLTGRWGSRVSEQYHPYVVPQEHGAHDETRWFSLTDAAGDGIRISSAQRFSFSARFHHDAALTAASTLAELTADDRVEVHVDAAVRGLGTAACGPDALPDYLVGPGRRTWSFVIEHQEAR